ncbi:large neutral amino acids transporter small subunit 1-like [Argopecten irradians]|uniref:large neutral amino acids transporter small subunit 1-like n=1 Tax=Argopecten irradians TaxID=31199 RepID=UPI0037218C26
MAIQLKKQLGLIDGISYVSGAIIGSGIFISPSPILAGSGGSTGLALIIWGVCGLIAMTEALCFMEIVQRVRKSGGLYTFILESSGESVSFVFLWMHILVLRPMSIAVSGLASATYILRPLFPYCSDMAPASAVKLIATLIIMLYVFMNSYSIKRSAVMQSVLLACKLIAIGLIVIFGLLSITKGSDEVPLSNPFNFHVDNLSMNGIVFAVYVGIFAYGGGDSALYAFEEYVSPKRNIPLAIVIGHLIPIVAYLLVNVAYYTVLTTEEITSGLAVAVTFAEQCMGFLKWGIIACIVLSTSANINQNCFTSSRMIYVAAREDNFPKFLSMVNTDRRTLLPAMITIGCLGVVMLSLGSLLSTLKIYTILMQVSRLVAVYGLFKLRKTHTPVNVIKVPLFVPIFYLIMISAMIMVTVIYDPEVIPKALICASTGVVAIVLTKFSKIHGSRLRSIYKKMHESMVKITRAVLLSEFTETT